MIKAVIFDCFGVIVSDGLQGYLADVAKTQPDVPRQIWEFVEQANLGKVERAVWRQQAADLLGITTDELAHQIDTREKRNDELLAYIVRLREKYTTALLSNIATAGMAARFSDQELDRYFDKQYLSGKLGMTKPSPAIYEYVLRDLGYAPEECVFTDDRQEYLDAAATFGIHVIRFMDNTQFYDDFAKIVENADD